MKMLKSRKALSPVVASIILIAVTVAVSIAVAAWMGALTFQITNMSFGTSSIAVTVNNTGTSPVTINEAWVNNAKQSITNPVLPKDIIANAGIVLNITTTITTGYNYQVKLVSSKGNAFLYTAVAPG
jgi:flagellin-like protein